MIHAPACLLGACLALPVSFSSPTHQDTREESPARLAMEDLVIDLPGGGRLAAQRGKLTVPIVRSRPGSREITVDVWRFPALEGADPDTPPVFRLYGGPGWPGMEPEDVRGQGELAPILALADLVVVGQRGIGTSLPDTACADLELPEGELTREALDAALLEACRDCRSYWEEQGYDLSGLNVLEAAADVEDVRRLLGYGPITLWGGSYGSHWAMAILRRFPGSVARAVLHGLEGPDQTYDLPSGVLAALERIAQAAEEAPELRGRLPEGGLIAALREVIARLERRPVTVAVDGVEVRLSADDVRDAALGYSAGTGSRRGAATWPADVLALHAGEYAGLARAVHGWRRETGLPTASFFMLDCGSGISAGRRKLLEEDPAREVVGDLGHWYDVACGAWDADLGEDFRTRFSTDVPTLLVHGTWDTSTPLENALELLPAFGEHTFVLVEGGSHGALNEAIRHSAPFRNGFLGFLRTGETADLPLDVVLPPLEWAVPGR